MACELCGCTDARPCLGEPSGEPCHWVEPNLCSACAGPQDEEDLLSSTQEAFDQIALAQPPHFFQQPIVRQRPVPRRVA